ncbi:MAG: transcriptional repressor LexA [Bifidobacteriaceae bacterium]|jgi:repressor LexA|nr:transcriptional repressor LexA [Bifidobacteriaceae bacterium]
MRTTKEFPRTPKRGLTPRQRQIYEVILESVKRRGYAPSMREVGEIVKLSSPSSVKHQLEVLEAKGYIRRDPRVPRAIEVIDPTADVPQRLRASGEEQPAPRYVPLVGRIAAGTPILAEQMVDGLYPLPREFVGQGEVFMLKVQGDSMTGAGILDGDHVVVRSQPSAENGEIVAAQLDDEATVKTLVFEDGRAWLAPRNPAYERIEAIQAHILGRVVTVIRTI